jgi:hypothetical protein
MKYFLLCFSLIIGLSQAYAQPPTIDSMLIDESKSTLTIHGDFGSARGKVWCDSVELPIINWLNHRIIATLPDTGKGSAGAVVVGGRSYFSKQRMITRWDGDYGTITMERHTMYDIVDYKKDLFTFRADLHSMLVQKKFYRIHTQLMKGSVHEEGYSSGRWRNSSGVWISNYEKGTVPFLEASTTNDSSFHCKVTLDFEFRKGDCFIYDINGITTYFSQEWGDNTGWHSTMTYGKTAGENFRISFKFDSLFQITYDRIFIGTETGLDTTNVVQLRQFAPPPAKALALQNSPSIIAPDNGEENLGTIGSALQWDTLELMEGYHIQFSPDSIVNVQGSSQSPQAVILLIDTVVASTSFTLPTLEKNTKYFWRAAGVNEEGESNWSTARSFVTGNDAATRDEKPALESIHIFPNPARSSITIIAESEVKVDVIDIFGRSVATSNGPVHTWTFSLPSKGIYFAKIVSPDRQELRKLIAE